MSERKVRPCAFSQSGDPDCIYFNVAVTGAPEVGNGETSTVATTDIQRAQPIVGNPRDYYCSLIRATVPLALAPILVVPHIGTTDVTPYVIGIRFGNAGYFTSSPLVWVPEQYGLEAQAKDLRYHMRSYESFASMVNAALLVAFNAFVAANPGAPQAIAGVAPFIYFDAVTDEFVWVYNNAWNTVGPAALALGAAEARVTVNASLISVLDGWRTLYVGDPTTPDNYGNLVWQNTGANAYTLNGIANSSFSRPSSNQLEYMSSIRRIVITSASLPVAPEAIPTVGSSSLTTGVQNSTLNVLGDYVPQIGSGGDARSVAYFTPAAQWRLLPLLSDTPISRIQITFYWQAASGELYPILVPKGQQCSCKLAFVRRDLYETDV